MTTGCDSEEAALIFQCDQSNHLLGLQISTLIPSIVMPKRDTSEISKQISKQKATGRTFDGTTFPLCLWIKHHDFIDNKNIAMVENLDNKRILDITIRVSILFIINSMIHSLSD